MITIPTSNDNSAACDFFALEGTIDAHSEALLMAIPARVKHPVVRFDFTNAGRINSMGVALLLRCFKEIRSKAEIRLEGLSQMHAMLFKMTGVFLLATPVERKKEAAA
ncbi:STAS domain-containing protein [Geomonas propionica]|uniref:STAS domain-containing protein n=1 Tax=Geomonas propionica TaxID=2798582 RepID=A0ABS0YT26_9BACT|nr:STAS domain-containing protein [Geomonas propionica]MBJ6801081.1 STAS domain-containing protein [Geomonas propionica]